MIRTIGLSMVVALGFSAAGAARAASFQPPMDSVSNAYYTCASSGAFLVSYDGATPTAATLTTSNNNRTYALKRTRVSAGAEFKGGGASFWTDGTKVEVTGTEAKLNDCQRKTP